MHTRKSFTELTDAQRDAFLEAVLILKNTIANPGAPPARRVNIYDQYVALHRGVMSLTIPSGRSLNFGHRNAMFLPWHRQYLVEFEQSLRAVKAGVTLPYWDWTERAKTASELFQDDFMGPINPSGQLDIVRSGYFTQDAANPTPPWWPAGLAGWRIRAELQPFGLPSNLRESLVRGGGSTNSLPRSSTINALLDQTSYNSFRIALEEGVIDGFLHPTHNALHGWVGGHMSQRSSPNDPVFFMHHCYVDKLWADWQADGHQNDYPVSAPPAFGLNDPMWPWVTNPDDYQTPAAIAPLLPSFPVADNLTPADVLDIAALDYGYE